MSGGGEEALRVAVLTDMHGNADAYESALRAARSWGFDALVLLGDLYTYGCKPARVMALTEDSIARDRATLIRGNHDQIYLELATGHSDYFERLPDWIRESVEWTVEQVGREGLGTVLPWVDERVIERAHFAHANPFGALDWTYLRDDASVSRAVDALLERSLPLGVYGHTHRRLLAAGSRGTPPTRHDAVGAHEIDLADGTAWVINPGAVGQPRDAERRSTFLTIELRDDTARAEFHEIDYDLDAHLRAIARSSMSEKTRSKLAEFFTQEA